MAKGVASATTAVHHSGGWRGDNTTKNYGVAMLGEFVGTFLFLFFAFAGTMAAKTSSLPYQPGNFVNGTLALAPGADPKAFQASPDLLVYVALSFGFSLGVNVWLFYRVSGGLFNPAVTLGFVLIGAMPVVKAALLMISQILGGIAAAGVVSAILPGDLLLDTTLGGGISTAQGFFLEMFLTIELILTIFLIAVEKHRATFMAPAAIGLALFIAHLVGIFYTGASLNPARSFGVAVVNGYFPNYHWIYWVGPFLGAGVSAGFYKLLVFLNYQTVNPGQDGDGSESSYIENRDSYDDRRDGPSTHISPV